MVKPYHKNKIGRCIGWGGEHLVFEYGEDQVIKFSLHVLLSGKSAVDKIQYDYDQGLKYFQDYIWPTDIITWHNGSKCIEIQQKVQCRFLRKDDLCHPIVKQQFVDIMSRYDHMATETNQVFDLLGREGLLKRKLNYISNILITPERKLILIDFTILNINKPKFREWPLRLIIMWARYRQKKLLLSFTQ